MAGEPVIVEKKTQEVSHLPWAAPQLQGNGNGTGNGNGNGNFCDVSRVVECPTHPTNTASRLGKGTGQRKRRILRRLTILRSCVRDNPGLVTGPGLVQNPEPSHMFVSTSLHPQAERRGRGRAGGGEESFVFGLLFATQAIRTSSTKEEKKSFCFSQTRRTATWALLSNPFSHSKIMARHATIKPAWWVTGTLPGRAPFSCDGEVEP